MAIRSKLKINTVHHGHALELARQLSDDFLSLILTSPPYFGLRNYDLPPTDWPAVEYSPMAGLPPVSIPAWAGCLGLEPDPLMYVGHLVALFRELRRALHPSGSLWLNLGDNYTRTNVPQSKHKPVEYSVHCKIGSSDDFTGRGDRPGHRIGSNSLPQKNLLGIPWRTALALQADGWWLRSDAPWIKSNSLPESVADRPGKGHEYWFLLTKQPRYYYDRYAVMLPSARPGDTQTFGGEKARNGDDPRNNGREDGARQWGKNYTTGSGRNRRTTDVYLESLDVLITQQRDYLAHLESIREGNGLLGQSDGDPAALLFPVKGYSGAHFATFNADLIKPLILASTSERGVCPACREPWVRVVEKSTEFHSGSGKTGNPPNGKYAGSEQAESGEYDIRMGPVTTAETTGWRPGCDCLKRECSKKATPGVDGLAPDDGQWGNIINDLTEKHKPIPAVILDPFMGSGTTAEVAIKHHRDYMGFELNPDYIGLYEERVNGVQIKLL